MSSALHGHSAHAFFDLVIPNASWTIGSEVSGELEQMLRS